MCIYTHNYSYLYIGVICVLDCVAIALFQEDKEDEPFFVWSEMIHDLPRIGKCRGINDGMMVEIAQICTSSTALEQIR